MREPNTGGHQALSETAPDQSIDLQGNTANLTEELARLLAATIAQGQQGKRLPGLTTGSELASLAALVSASQNQRPAQPVFRDGLSSLSYTPAPSPAPAAYAPSPTPAPMQPAAPVSSSLLINDHHDDEPMPIPSTWRQPDNNDDERWYRQQLGAAALGLLAGLIVVVPAVLWLSGWLGGPQAKAGRQAMAEQGNTIKMADVKVRVVPLEKTENASQYVTASIDPRQAAVEPPPPVVEKTPVVVPPKVAEPPRPKVEDLVAEAKQRINRGDIAGARELLTSAQNVAPGPITFALAETYDPNMLASWQLRGAGVVAEPERAKALYSRALEFGFAQAQKRLDMLDPRLLDTRR